MLIYVTLGNQRTIVELRVNTFNSQITCLLILVIIEKLYRSKGDKQLCLEILKVKTKTYFIKHILCVKCGQEVKESKA